MEFKLNEYRRELTDEEIIENIQLVAKDLNTDYLSISTYKKYGKYSYTAIQGHFGTWKNALKLAGLRIERNSSELKRITEQELLSDLKKVAKSLNKSTITFSEYTEYGLYSSHNYLKRFGTWEKALALAGLEPTGLSRKRIEKQELFDEIERMWRLLGRQPTSTDIIKGNICKYSIDTFKRRFGGYRAALEEFVDYINSDQDINDEAEKTENKSELNNEKEQQNDNDVNQYVPKAKTHTTSRNVNARLRFRVMQRDNFKCCICGASPAKDPSVELHIDHIIPWSKGGETTIDNLQTLCSKCNLGKSDLL